MSEPSPEYKLDLDLDNKLKKPSTRQLEQAIAEAVGTLIGVECKCTIASIKYGAGIFNSDSEVVLTLKPSSTTKATTPPSPPTV